MFDGLFIQYDFDGKSGNIAAFDGWEVLINERTGKRVDDNKTAHFRGLDLALKPCNTGGYHFQAKGSLHKYYNAGNDNAGQFSFTDVLDAVGGFCNVFGLDAKECRLHGLEIGVNIKLPYSPLRVLKNAVCYKGKPFTQINKRNARKGLICSLSQYDVKLYDKAAQSGIDCGNVLRLEVKAHKMQFLKDYGFATLSDLCDPYKAYAAKRILIDVLDCIVWTDTAADLNRFSARELKQWLYLSNPKSWQDVTKVTAFRQRQKLELLLSKYGAFSPEKDLRSHFVLCWESLFLNVFEAKKMKPFYKDIQDGEAHKYVTFLPFIWSVKKLPISSQSDTLPNTRNYITKNINIYSANGAITDTKDRQEASAPFAQNPPDRCCASCGKDISKQRKNSRFCSAKYVGIAAAKHCRNANSNHRRNLKLKINKAIMINNFIAVTYTDTSGAAYTDTLHPTELQAIPPKWFDRIKSIAILPDKRGHPPEKLDGQKAKDFLTQLFNS